MLNPKINSILRMLMICLIVALVASCNSRPPTVTLSPFPSAIATSSRAVTAVPTTLPTETPLPPRVLNICLGSEPQSLFLYQAFSQAERSVLQAIYDGPYDILKDGFEPVILAKNPSLADGDVTLEAVDVSPGAWVVAADGELTMLEEGTPYRPVGCSDRDCELLYAPDQPIQMDQLVVRFTLLPDLVWSNGTPLTADDSLYSYEVAKGLFSPGQFPGLDMTASYQVLDATTVEWRGIPGYLNTHYLMNFYSPLPRQAWEFFPLDQLTTAEQVARTPLGWGPYSITEWVTGDHITLQKNPTYFRASEGLPHFDNLVYRFVADGEEALEALLAGECDLIDQSAALELQIPYIEQLQRENNLKLFYQQDTAWEFIALGIESINPQRPKLFAQTQVRQAIAMCLNRQQMVDELMFGHASVPDVYLPFSHPLYASGLSQYAFDPDAAEELLNLAGWVDQDNDPTTPRTALGVPSIPDGTQFELTYLVSTDAERQETAKMVQTSLAACGIKVNLDLLQPADYLAVGPDGPVFGRNFDMAQFALPVLLMPPCQFFTSAEITGPYPTFPKGWGGMNVSGYRNLSFDQACQSARATLPETTEYQSAHAQAQTIFAQDLPFIPLYTRFKVLVSALDVCQLSLERAYNEALWNLELLDKGDDCQ